MVGAVALVAAGVLAYVVVDGNASDASPAAQQVGSSSGAVSDSSSDAGAHQGAKPDPLVEMSDPEGGGGAVLASGRHEAPAWVSTAARVRKHEALPCTGATEPINFEVFSAGPAVGGLPVTSSIRRCDAGAPVKEDPDNYFAYVYGRCEPEPDVGCLPPLQVRSYPACERSYADYSYEGKPEPYRDLPSIDGAKVVEIEFITGPRIEVYSGTATIVISAADPALAQEALAQLAGQEAGDTLATTGAALDDLSDQGLEPPAKGAIEGGLPCDA